MGDDGMGAGQGWDRAGVGGTGWGGVDWDGMEDELECGMDGVADGMGWRMGWDRG